MSSDKLFEMLRRHEGVKQFAYRCTANKITIGVGRCVDEDGGIGLCDAEIDLMAGMEFDNSLWSQQVGARAEELCQMIETGEYEDASA